MLFPLWILLWISIPLAIWIEDRGPIFYLQDRVGLGGRIFKVIKFRTMIPNAEKATGPVWAMANDARITRIGRLLRKTALDELPQTINILKGDMSFVGPRAERPELNERFSKQIKSFDQRLSIRPGLTGLSQLNGSYDIPPRAKLRYDLVYIKRMSPWLDLNLLLLSLRNTLLGRWDHRTTKTSKKSPGGHHDQRKLG